MHLWGPSSHVAPDRSLGAAVHRAAGSRDYAGQLEHGMVVLLFWILTLLVGTSAHRTARSGHGWDTGHLETVFVFTSINLTTAPHACISEMFFLWLRGSALFPLTTQIQKLKKTQPKPRASFLRMHRKAGVLFHFENPSSREKRQKARVCHY